MLHLSVVLDCRDLRTVTDFWSAALGYVQVAADDVFVGLRDPDGRMPTLVLQQVPEPKVVKNRMHLDVFSDRFDDELMRLLDLGATVLTPDHLESDGTRLTVLADPEGNEFCLLALPPT